MAENLMKILREACTVASYADGMECYHADSVGRLVKRDSVLQTKVSGQGVKRYRVAVTYHPVHDTVQAAHCSCLYSSVGWCKHIVATLLKCHYEPHNVAHRPTLTYMLDGMNYAQTRHLVHEMVATKPGLIEMVDRIYHDVEQVDDDEDSDDRADDKVEGGDY